MKKKTRKNRFKNLFEKKNVIKKFMKLKMKVSILTMLSMNCTPKFHSKDILIIRKLFCSHSFWENEMGHSAWFQMYFQFQQLSSLVFFLLFFSLCGAMKITLIFYFNSRKRTRKKMFVKLNWDEFQQNA